MNRLVSLAMLAIVLLGTTVEIARSEDPAPQVSTTPLKGSLFLLQGRGGNVVASVGADGILLVDDDYGPYAPAYQQALAGLAVEFTPEIPRFVINTHWHGDHTGSNGFWGARGAAIVAHSNVRLRMSTRQERKTMGRVDEPRAPAALPIVTYGDSLALHFNGDDIEIRHYPRGHTDGDSVVFFSGENVVHLGDHFFSNAYPFIDLDSGGSLSGYSANIAALIARVDDKTIIVPGHGAGAASKADLERYHDMLITTTATVSSGLAQGLSIEAITERGLGERWSAWGKGFIDEAKWIATIAASL